MKYSILINQSGIHDFGLIGVTDIVDWALLDYISYWQSSPSAVRVGQKVWINYKHVIREMPLLGLNGKGAVANRIKKIKELGLIDTHQDKDDFRLYAETTMLYHSICSFRVDIQQHLKAGLPVRQNEHPFTKMNTPVHRDEHPVHHGEHSSNNQLSNNQDIQNNIVHLPKSGKSDKQELEQSFSEFWSMYPRKEAKSKALASWMKLKPDSELLEKILGGIAKAKSLKWHDPQFIPLPATYLNGQRWEDEIVQTQKSPAITINDQGFDSQPKRKLQVK